MQRRSTTPPEIVREGFRSRFFKQRVELHVAAPTTREIGTVSLTEGGHSCSPVLLPDRSVSIAAPIVETSIAIFLCHHHFPNVIVDHLRRGREAPLTARLTS